LPRTILIVDDHPSIREMVRIALEREGFQTREATNGAEALTSFRGAPADLIVLDISMPELDGLSVCREIRKFSTAPILFVSSRDEEVDRIIGLEIGGDDYLTKPFSPRELVARVKVILRRFDVSSNALKDAGAIKESSPEDTHATMSGAGVTLNLIRCEARWKDTPVVLTATEFAILKAMMRWPGKVWSRTELMDKAWDMATTVSDRTIDSHVRRLRQKFAAIGASPIETVHGFGYKLSDGR